MGASDHERKNIGQGISHIRDRRKSQTRNRQLRLLQKDEVWKKKVEDGIYF